MGRTSRSLADGAGDTQHSVMFLPVRGVDATEQSINE
jgi:hypothetical protein